MYENYALQPTTGGFFSRMSSYVPKDTFWRYFLMGVLTIGFGLFVWWFAKRVIGRDLKIPQTYDPSAQNANGSPVVTPENNNSTPQSTGQNNNTPSQSTGQNSNNNPNPWGNTVVQAQTPEQWNLEQAEKLHGVAKGWCPSQRADVYKYIAALPDASVRAIDAVYRQQYKRKIADDVFWSICAASEAVELQSKLSNLGLD